MQDVRCEFIEVILLTSLLQLYGHSRSVIGGWDMHIYETVGIGQFSEVR